MRLPRLIISGGQTGADRGALDAAMELQILHGGWCPRDRRTEDGRAPERYALCETSSSDYPARTRRNIEDSEGTLLVTRGTPDGGSLLTLRIAARLSRLLLHIDLNTLPLEVAVQEIREWMVLHQVNVLNVAGPCESHCAGIGEDTRLLLVAAFKQKGSRRW
jgi:hypothetical protein